jgi:hypothetical protein
MKNALLLIPGTGVNIDRQTYIQSCAEKVLADGYMPITPAVYETYIFIDVEQFVDNALPIVDVVYLFVDFGIDKDMFDVIDRAVSSKKVLRYKRVATITGKKLYMTPIQTLLDIAKRSGFSVDQLKSRSRKREIVDTRYCYFRKAKESSRASLASIGAEVDRDHASVMHGIREAREQSAVVDLYNRLYGQTKIETPSLGQDKTGRISNIQPIQRPVLPYRSMDKREQNVPSGKSIMCSVPAGGYYNAFSGYRPHNT